MQADKIKLKRVLMSLTGVVICGFSVGIFKTAALGVDPFQSLMGGLNYIIPWKYGTLYLIANIALLLFSLLTDRHNLGIATVLNLTLLGYIVQYVYEKLHAMIAHPSMMESILLLAIGLVIMCLGSSFYMTADMGISTYDAIARVCAEKWKLGRFRYCRICTDLVCVLIGAGLCIIGGGSKMDLLSNIGIGTVLTAFFMGPLIEFFNKSVKKLL